MARIKIRKGMPDVTQVATDGVMIMTPVHWYVAPDRDRALREVRPQQKDAVRM